MKSQKRIDYCKESIPIQFPIDSHSILTPTFVEIDPALDFRSQPTCKFHLPRLVDLPRR